MKTAANLFCLFGVFIFTAQLAHGQEVTAKAKSKFGEDRSVVYKECEGDDLSLYFFVPENKEQAEARPAIVFFFGGGWTGGTPDQFKTHAAYLKSRGMIAILADYRTKNSHGTSPRECVADAKSAIRYVRSHAEELGVDPSHIAASGGSAGGHLAAATATLTGFDEAGEDQTVSAVPNALVLFNPVYDNGPGQWGHERVSEYWQEISPAHNIRAGMPPAITFLGDQDKLIPVATAESFQKKMEAIGSRSDLHLYPGKGHGFFNINRDKNVAFLDTVKKMDAFLVEVGFLQGSGDIEAYLREQATRK